MGTSNEGCVGGSAEEAPRKEFLLKMYDQMFADINRHILVVWQSAAVLVGAVAIFALTEKQIISLDVATALIVLLAAWFIAHVYEASAWYNRNLAIIANIEKLFLRDADLTLVHYYFGGPRPKNRMISQLRIQYLFALGFGAIVLVYHFQARVLPGFTAQGSHFDPQRALPYIVLGVAVGCIWRLSRNMDASYNKFLKNSPGRPVDVMGIEFGVGHGYRKGETPASVIPRDALRPPAEDAIAKGPNS